jgi:ribosomal peptide maturation radical SAM protein 1
MQGRRLHLVCMPWHSLKYPSLALGLLSAQVRAKRPGWQVVTSYYNLRWAQHLHDATGGRMGLEEYSALGEEKQRSAPGEWAFSAALHSVQDWRVEDYRRTFVHSEELFGMVLQAHRLAPAFIESLADEICSNAPDLLGLTSTFAQNVACLALAKAIKRRLPSIRIVMGGANCDGIMGQTLHREFQDLDFVVSGEGEDALVQLVEAIDGEREFHQVQNLTWRGSDGHSVVNAQASTADIAGLQPPDFDAFFEQQSVVPVASTLETALVLETSRGCWWGAKHHCTFCGLNGSVMAYRKKPANTILEEITQLTARYQTLDIIMADNIIAMESFDDLLPALRRSPADLRVQFEIKANLGPEHIALLRDARVLHVQPGIESLSTSVLKLMDKGVTAAQNIYLLREMEAQNITVSWNLLAGFPGEQEAHYLGMLAAFPNLEHLQPPIGITRILIQRFSPFFDKPWLGFIERRPSPCYEVIYDRNPTVLHDMVYMFESPPQGIGDALIERFEEAIAKWGKAYRRGARLSHRVVDGKVRILDRRSGRATERLELDAELESPIYQELDRPTRLPGLMRRLRAVQPGLGREQVQAALDRLHALGLVFVEDGWYLRLSIGHHPYRIRQEHCVVPPHQQTPVPAESAEADHG